MEVVLKKVTLKDKATLKRLLGYSLYEESLTDGNKMNNRAVFEYKWFNSYFTDSDRLAFIIYYNKEIAGFVMINKYVQRIKSGHSIAEFMVVPYMRHMHIGSFVATKCFEMFDGYWEVSPSVGSDTALTFWKNVINDYTGGNYDFKDGIFVFKSKK